jgi:hypothetical protein
MENGFIYEAASFVIEGLEKLNLVELFKFLARKLNPHKRDKIRENAYSRFAVDIFILLKFIFLAVIWVFGFHGLVLTVFVWYLIIMNLHTYFYRHIWCEDAVTSANLLLHRVRRRFVNLFLALTFSNLSFAYLYNLPYASGFNWGTTPPSFFHAVWFSFSNSVAANYAVVMPVSDLANSVTMIQLMITFIFVTIIISRSLPQTTP